VVGAVRPADTPGHGNDLITQPLLRTRRTDTHTTYATEPRENINSIFLRLREAWIEGRIVLDFTA
jgi:hypothetical protein